MQSWAYLPDVPSIWVTSVFFMKIKGACISYLKNDVDVTSVCAAVTLWTLIFDEIMIPCGIEQT